MKETLVDQPRRRRIEQGLKSLADGAAKEEGGLVESPAVPPVEFATEESHDKTASGQRAKKVKVTLSLSERLASRIFSVAAALKVDPCDVVERLLGPALAGVRPATVPEALKGAIAPKGRSAS
jgi:hypothetical protein